MSFGITPVSGTVPATSETFPDFIQFKANDVALGAADADTVNFVGGTVTRGTGESSGVVTVDFSGFTWREEPADFTIVKSDSSNGVASTGGSGAQMCYVPGDTGDVSVDFAIGASVLLYQAGTADLEIVPVSGVTIDIRNDLLFQLADQYAPATLIKKAANHWIICGDLLPLTGAVGGDSLDYGSIA